MYTFYLWIPIVIIIYGFPETAKYIIIDSYFAQ